MLACLVAWLRGPPHRQRIRGHLLPTLNKKVIAFGCLVALAAPSTAEPGAPPPTLGKKKTMIDCMMSIQWSSDPRMACLTDKLQTVWVIKTSKLHIKMHTQNTVGNHELSSRVKERHTTCAVIGRFMKWCQQTHAGLSFPQWQDARVSKLVQHLPHRGRFVLLLESSPTAMRWSGTAVSGTCSGA